MDWLDGIDWIDGIDCLFVLIEWLFRLIYWIDGIDWIRLIGLDGIDWLEWNYWLDLLISGLDWLDGLIDWIIHWLDDQPCSPVKHISIKEYCVLSVSLVTSTANYPLVLISSILLWHNRATPLHCINNNFMRNSQINTRARSHTHTHRTHVERPLYLYKHITWSVCS